MREQSLKIAIVMTLSQRSKACSWFTCPWWRQNGDFKSYGPSRYTGCVIEAEMWGIKMFHAGLNAVKANRKKYVWYDFLYPFSRAGYSVFAISTLLLDNLFSNINCAQSLCLMLEDGLSDVTCLFGAAFVTKMDISLCTLSIVIEAAHY